MGVSFRRFFGIIGLSLVVSNLAFTQGLSGEKEKQYKHAITVGILQGGGSLLGVDAEVLLVNNLGFQIGLGVVGFGAALNYHFEPQVNSSAISLTYCNQGLVGENLVSRMLGVTYL
jgi:hypothetical protein